MATFTVTTVPNAFYMDFKYCSINDSLHQMPQAEGDYIFLQLSKVFLSKMIWLETDKFQE